MTVTVTKLYEILSKKVGKEEAEVLTTYVEEKIVDEFEKNKSSIVNEIRVDIEKLRTEMAQLRTEMHQTLRNQLWAMIALFFPLYFTIIYLILNLIKK